jgi:hypothetical protein
MPYRPLSGAFEKVRRANQHIKALEFELTELQTFSPYRVEIKQDHCTFEWVEIKETEALARGISVPVDAPLAAPGNVFVPVIHAEDIGVYLRIFKAPSLITWGVLIGDIVHNLRSALDQLAWELSINYQRSLPTPLVPLPIKGRLRGGHWRRVQFQVSPTPYHWTENSKKSLRLIDQRLLPKFEDEQPYKLGRQYQRHWLWLLNELWNSDKHRLVAITAMYTAPKKFRLLPPPSGSMNTQQFAAEFDVTMPRFESAGRYRNGLKIGRFHAVRRNPRVNQPAVDFNIEAIIEVGIKFKKVAPTYGEGVLNSLERLSAEVERVLNSFMPDFK